MTTSNEECCICLETLVEDHVTKLPCDHTLHTKCIRDYAKSLDNKDEMPCPLCRQEVIIVLEEEQPPTQPIACTTYLYCTFAMTPVVIALFIIVSLKYSLW